MKELAGSITSDPALLADLISSLPESVKEKQELENPYVVGTTLHDRFANGWYSGYIGTQILSFYVGGGGVLQTVKSSERFAQLTKSVLAKMGEIKAFLKVSKELVMKTKIGLFLADDAATVSLQLPLDFFSRIKSAAQQVIILNKVKKLIGITYDGTWSPGIYGDAAKNFKLGHYDIHVVQNREWGEIISPETYRQKAVELINTKSGVEKYIDIRTKEKKLVVYNRATMDLVVGNEYKEIATLFKRPVRTIDKIGVDDLVDAGGYIPIN